MPDVASGVEFSMAVLCYRGVGDIIPFVENLHRIMSKFQFSWEIVLVANYWPGQADLTAETAERLAASLSNVSCIALPKKGGMGWDARAGLNACRGKYIGFIDGDGQFPVEAVFSCFAKISSDDFDLVKTYRVARGDGLARALISTIYNCVFRVLFPDYRGHGDVNSKPKIMKREVYLRMDLESDDWFFDAEIVLNCLAMNLRIYEIPINFHSLDNRKSFVRFTAIFEFVRHLFNYRFGPRYRRHTRA